MANKEYRAHVFLPYDMLEKFSAQEMCEKLCKQAAPFGCTSAVFKTAFVGEPPNTEKQIDIVLTFPSTEAVARYAASQREAGMPISAQYSHDFREAKGKA